MSKVFETLCRSDKRSKCNTQFIRPHIPWADNLISHRLSREAFMDVLEKYGGRDQFDVSVVTRYYHEDMTLEVDGQKRKRCYMFLPEHTVTPAGQLELFQGTKIDLSVTRFPLNNYFHHERQLLLLRQEGIGYVLEMEILLPLIREPHERYADVEQIFSLSDSSSDSASDPALQEEEESDDDDLRDPSVSYSYQFQVKNAGVLRWSEHVGRLGKK